MVSDSYHIILVFQNKIYVHGIMTDLEHEIRLELKQGSLCSDRLPSKICFQH